MNCQEFHDLFSLYYNRGWKNYPYIETIKSLYCTLIQNETERKITKLLGILQQELN